MASDRYLPFLPAILNWIQQTLDAHAREKRPAESFKFPRLPQDFSEELLNSASVVITDRLPRPPLSALGLTEFADFEKQPISGITYPHTPTRCDVRIPLSCTVQAGSAYGPARCSRARRRSPGPPSGTNAQGIGQYPGA